MAEPESVLPQLGSTLSSDEATVILKLGGGVREEGEEELEMILN